MEQILEALAPQALLFVLWKHGRIRPRFGAAVEKKYALNGMPPGNRRLCKPGSGAGAVPGGGR